MVKLMQSCIRVLNIRLLVLFNTIIQEALTKNALPFFQNGVQSCMLQKAPTHQAVLKQNDSSVNSCRSYSTS